MRKGPSQGIRSTWLPVHWHRSVAKADHGLQGWKRERICPDLIFAPGGNADAGRILVPEIKWGPPAEAANGYKRNVPDHLPRSFADQVVPAGQLRISLTGEAFECARQTNRIPSSISDMKRSKWRRAGLDYFFSPTNV